MNEEQFQVFCTLLMCDDPSQLTVDQRQIAEDFAASKAEEFGYQDWIAFYHDH